jgi:hypothetical protein
MSAATITLPAHHAQILDELDAHLHTLHRGLQCLLHLLAGANEGATIEPGNLHALLAPLADEASQAAPLARMVADKATA